MLIGSKDHKQPQKEILTLENKSQEEKITSLEKTSREQDEQF